MNTKKPLWEPDEERRDQANMTRFIGFVNQQYGLEINSYAQLHNWSIENIPDFWAAMWEFGEIKASQSYTEVVDDLSKFPGAKWFGGARLNFAENLLRYRDDHLAFIFRGETQKSATMTYAELYNAVARLAHSLRERGVAPGDRVVAYMPNLIETAIAMLAATSIGATWASCATDIGPLAALDRLGQVEPKVLFTVDGYFYKNKLLNTLGNAAKVAKEIPSLEKVVVVSYATEEPDISPIPNAIHYEEFLAKERQPAIQFEQLPFDHPVFIMFSSGTTGKPKCMVQGVGGVLINHLKELLLHTDLKRDDRIMYITTCSWMMWNWLLSSLGVGATVVLYDGNPNYPDAGAMWKLIQDEKITVFGTSATYIHYLQKQGMKPGQDYDLSSLKQISQTGSALSTEGFEYAYREIKQDLHFNSISGGTDINGCFAAGNPISPVYAGELQGPALAMKVKAYDEEGNAIYDQQGELVCEAPAPSMPLYFWNDPDGQKYRNAYFTFYPDKNVWRHGDYIVIHSDTGGITFYGRSDAVLKPSGVRIGTAEIYNVVESLEGVADSLAIGQSWQGDQRIILFVKLAEGFSLTKELKNKIKKVLRENASPRHVPALIVEVPDIPYTFSMKKVESAVTNIINGRPVLNRDALINPESLDYYERILPELQGLVLIGSNSVQASEAWVMKPQFLPLTTYCKYSVEEMIRRAAAFCAEMQRRRTVRHFSDQPVPPEVIEHCLRAAATAPSGANLQPWHFVVVTDPDIKRQIRAAAEEREREFYQYRAPQEWLEALAPLGTSEHKPFLETAPYLIAIFVERYGLRPDGTKTKRYYTQESVGIATGILITAIHHAGLVALTYTPSPMGFLNEILGRPANERPFLLLVVGYPADDAVVPDIRKKSLQEVVTFV